MIQVGDIIPDGTLQYVPYTPNEDLKACPLPQPYKIHQQLKGKKVVLFAIPGPFTPACSNTHVPGYINSIDALQAKGVSDVICLSVTDGFVMNAFGKISGVKDKMIMAGDGSAEFSKALGLDQDLTKNGMGIRSKRFAIVVDDLVVKYIGVEPARGVTVSGAEAVLAKL
ncbi:Redoxin [Halteromyces radiatus]|uniref:Redoxin n=1 Tax=Halteromyces radiatus TaxID=101107 RepID=UPI002220C99D|nr:Redoxin [Halteromyces radiatus]KAI8081308.1 Redoxin [Halteromyces radiatus]